MIAHTLERDPANTARTTPAAAPNLIVTNPATGEQLGTLPQQLPSDLPTILATARSGATITRALSRHARAEILDRTAQALRARSTEFAELIVREAGKTITQARAEVARAANTMLLSAGEARRGGGEEIPFDAYAGADDRRGWFSREPLGIILAITPYNDALNLVAHKLGPAIAGGNAVILKPAQQTPLTARLLVDTLRESGLPMHTVTVVHGDRDLAQALVREREIRMVSFTGGFRTGEAISANAGIKRLSMELGGNAPVLVFSDAELPRAVEACVSGAFWAAGQNCIGTQRILVHASVYEEFRAAFVAATERLTTGDPRLDTTDVGPMITPQAALAAADAIADAVTHGARLLSGGTVDGPFFTPAVLESVPATHPLVSEEVFAPVVVLEQFTTFEEAIEHANRSEYALHAGVFTSNLATAMRAIDAIDASGVMVNDSSDFRIDAMPFGGTKYGSMGREGVRFAYEEMTQPKVVCLRA